MLGQGTTVAGYRVDGVLGEGGMAVVYRATQLSLNRVVALKLLSAELSDDPAFRARFQREGQLQAGLDHLHIVPVYEAGQSEHGLFLAMRLIDGPTLKQLILTRQLDPRRSLRLLAQVAQALDEAHAAGLIHRDIKPQNILIGERDHVYLADFGLIKAPDEVGLTGTGQFMGTIDYVAPEQIQGEPATAASDCYALAAVLFECLTGRVPFPRPTEAATLYAHVTEAPPRVSELSPDLPPALDEVIASGMAKDPAQRPSSVTELIRSASRALGTAAATTGATVPQATRLSAPTIDAGERGQVTRGHDTRPAGRDAPTIAAERAADPRAEPTIASSAGLADSRAAGEQARERPRAAAGVPARAGLVLALAIALIAGGFLLGHSGGGGQRSASFPNSATVGHLQLRYPSGWKLGATVPNVPGISFTDPLTLSAGGGQAGMTAGEVLDAAGPTLLPASFRAKLAGSVPAPTPVLLDGLAAYRYSGLSVSGLRGALTLYAVPTSAGVATVVCWAATSSAIVFERDCARVAATLRLVGAMAYGLAPSAQYAQLLSTTFGQLRTAVSGPAARLQTARTPSLQAAAALGVAQAYTQAETRLSRAAVSPVVRDAHDLLLSALRQLADGYAHVAAAARSGSNAAYRAAGLEIGRGSASVSGAFRALAGLGYHVGR